MPEAVLTLRLNPHTGERTLIINYESDEDAMPFEHEDEHRAFVEQLLGKSLEQVADRLEIKRSPPHPLMEASEQSLGHAQKTQEQDQQHLADFEPSQTTKVNQSS